MDQMDNNAVDLPHNEHIQDTTDTQFMDGVRKELDFGQTNTPPQIQTPPLSPAKPEIPETEFYISQTLQPELNPKTDSYPESPVEKPPQFGQPPQTSHLLPENSNFHIGESNFAPEQTDYQDFGQEVAIEPETCDRYPGDSYHQFAGYHEAIPHDQGQDIGLNPEMGESYQFCQEDSKRAGLEFAPEDLELLQEADEDQIAEAEVKRVLNSDNEQVWSDFLEKIRSVLGDVMSGRISIVDKLCKLFSDDSSIKEKLDFTAHNLMREMQEYRLDDTRAFLLLKDQVEIHLEAEERLQSLLRALSWCSEISSTTELKLRHIISKGETRSS